MKENVDRVMSLLKIIWMIFDLVWLCVHGQELNGACEVLIMPFCKDVLVYNMTRMPNLLGHKTQDEAIKHYTFRRAILDVQCDTNLRYFLCLTYAPTCSDTGETTVQPCGSVCDEVRNACEPVIQSYNFHWPSFWECGKFPKSGNNCIEKLPERRLERLETTTLASSAQQGTWISMTSLLLGVVCGMMQWMTRGM